MGSYTSFKKYFNYHQKLNLIKFVREEEPKYSWLAKRRYFTLVPENIDVIEAWKNPQIILYPAAVYGTVKYDKKKKEAKRNNKLGGVRESLTLCSAALRDFLTAGYRFLLLSLKNPSFRNYMKECSPSLSVSINFFKYLGYGVFVGRK